MTHTISHSRAHMFFITSMLPSCHALSFLTTLYSTACGHRLSLGGIRPARLKYISFIHHRAVCSCIFSTSLPPVLDAAYLIHIQFSLQKKKTRSNFQGIFLTSSSPHPTMKSKTTLARFTVELLYIISYSCWN